MSKLQTVWLTSLVLALLVLAVAAAVVASGAYPVSATRQHVQGVYSLLEVTMRQSVRLRARGIAVPPLDDPQLLQRGAACFRDKCVQCHGAPGVAPGDIGRGMQPLPGPLVDAQRHWNTRELYWITRYGIRMSGMPAWEARLPERDLWALVAFVEKLPQLSPQDYATATVTATATAAGSAIGPSAVRSQAGDASVVRCGFTQAERDAVPARVPDAARGKTALSQYACSSCHTVPGVSGSQPQVGPPLAGLARRTTIAGKLANTPENMVRWLRHPAQIDPLTAMPDLEVTEADARDMAAYLATLH